MKKTKIQAKEIIVYGFITCISNLLASFAVSLILKLFVKPLGLGTLIIALTYAILFVGVFAVSLAVLFCYLKNRVPVHYQPSDEKWLWIKNGVRLILPG